MKKFAAVAFALFLSLIMMTTAFADTVDFTTNEIEPGDKAKINSGSFVDENGVRLSIDDAYFSSNYFTLSYKVETGANLLEYVKFDDDGRITVKFKANYALQQPHGYNFKFKEMKVKAYKEIKNCNISKNSQFYAASEILEDKKIGYAYEDIYLNSESITINNPGFYRFKEDTYDYSELSFSMGDADVEVRVFDGDKMYLGVTDDPNADLLRKYPDAELDFITFKGHPTFSASARVELSAEKGDYLYEIKDGKLYTTNFKWDSSSYAFKGKALTLGSYVISDKPLRYTNPKEEQDKDKENEKAPNPGTGPNDAVGVAVALGVVSLITCGAVALKK